jgi:hypothetical protein
MIIMRREQAGPQAKGLAHRIPCDFAHGGGGNVAKAYP